VDVLLLSEGEVRALLDVEELMDALTRAFEAISRDDVSVPRRIATTVRDAGLVAAMPGYAPGIGLAVKLVAVFEGNVARGLPSHQALICAFDAATGSPAAIMDGTYITAMRTAAASAVSTRLLARRDCRSLAILGAGVQGASHLRTLPRVREFEEIRIASRDRAHAEALAATHPRARPVESFEVAVRGADVVAVCTHSGEPVVAHEWLSPGTHVTSVGYAPPHGELDRGIVERASLFVEARVAFAPPPAGCFELAGIAPERGVELGEVLLGRRPGRRDEREITVYKSMGHAMEDVAAAALVCARARERGVGRSFAMDAARDGA
jgi:ornithine cyclodeaminase/alanine dehydrogenase-like protein (mu-crystallin family)